MLRTLAKDRIAIYRTENQIIDPTTPTTLTDGEASVVLAVSVENLQRIKSVCSIVVSPAPAVGGVIRIDGTNSAGSVIFEAISIPESGVAQGETDFKTVTSVTIQGAVLNNKLVSVRYIGKDGSSIKARRTLSSCIPAQISRGRGNWNAQREGTVQSESLKILVPYICVSFGPREGDLIKDLNTGAEFIVTGAPLIQQLGISTFYDLSCQRYQNG